MMRKIVASLLAALPVFAMASSEAGRPVTHVETVRRAAPVAETRERAYTKITSRNAADCTWESIGRKWSVNPYMLYAIAKTESNLNPRAINRNNANGSEDVGMMQINSFWYPRLAKYGISREDLFDACVSLDVAGWILSQNMDRHGNTWTAVGAYNAVSPDKRIAYEKKVRKNLPPEAYNYGSDAGR